ncbi:MAG: hypothetical protein A3B37_02815 [Candidatus Sungbacteria bacterium RIFCSPLOWO2_01_FULL_59_16]|uniref:DOD-type homing endonuclease domain-containing protein n=1 Tax=Candidatus Sungbacteria bacterium RIFCSPLOWO2_01_FULL_59_16 TaxID=1802280 RepID=A0A1G2L9P6_9BACT|nr:MAG: hypothetical protein A3B37_02815 [Candidatus Sungbacteria bacterium RIFCSPLOWO2_01_FULL_59_16]
MEQKNKQAAGAEPIDVVNQYTGEKWYYSDIVKDHFFNPRNLLLEDRDETGYDAVGMVGSPACLLGVTRVAANPSLRTISEVSRGARLLGHDSRYHPVSRVFRVAYPRTELVRIRNYLGELVATSDHLVYAKRIPKTTTFRHHAYKIRIPSSWMHASDIRRGDIALYPLPSEQRHVAALHFPSRRRRWDFKSIPLPDIVPITPDLLEFFGYFIAEGHTKAGSEVGFTLAGHEQEIAGRIVALVREIFRLTATVRERPHQHRIDIAVYNAHLARNFRGLFGASAREKRVPEDLLFLRPELQRWLIKGLWLGDGYFSGRRHQPRAGFTTISPTLFEQMRTLLLRQRIVPSTFREPLKVRNGVRHRPSYRLHVGDMDSLECLAGILGIAFRRDPGKRHERRVWFEGNHLCLPVKRVSRAAFGGGRLYNFEIAESHTYATDAFLVHNCGDMLKMWMKVDGATEQIKELKWRTFGCASAIAATSMFSVMVTENGGMKIADALKIRPQNIMVRLGGLPNRKIHCSVLADKSFRKTVNDYFHRTGQHARVLVEGARVVDPKLNITDHDIEEAVLEGATDLDAVQRKLKVGVGSPAVITEVEQLIRFYKEKYYG